jgi:acetylornithine deacetylase/succinyl-diaminopimelate desuccinylase-like protein
VNLKFIVEGEEESGSLHFADLLRAHRDRLVCDAVVVSDTTMFGRDTPSICTAMRGIVDCQIDVHGPDIDLHSGSFGGAVPNPLTVLCELIAGLHDGNGRVTLPGFYDKVIPLTDAERAAFAKLPFDEPRWLTDIAKSRAAYGEAGFSTLERVWARPTAEVTGIWGGYTGPGHKSIIPTDAHAKLSFRLVASQDPLEVLAAVKQYLAERTPAGITVEAHFHGDGVRPCLTPIDHPANTAVVRAMERAFDSEILFTREGGSGPEADLAEVLDAPVVFLGVGLPDDRFHAPNERAMLPMLYKGAEAAAYLWREFAAMGTVGRRGSSDR